MELSCRVVGYTLNACWQWLCLLYTTFTDIGQDSLTFKNSGASPAVWNLNPTHNTKHLPFVVVVTRQLATQKNWVDEQLIFV